MQKGDLESFHHSHKTLFRGTIIPSELTQDDQERASGTRHEPARYLELSRGDVVVRCPQLAGKRDAGAARRRHEEVGRFVTAVYVRCNI